MKEAAKATEEISQRVTTIQEDSNSVTDSISRISEIIRQINNLQEVVSKAVGEQNSATNNMASVISRTAKGSLKISTNMTSISSAVDMTSKDAKQAKLASIELEDMSEKLHSLVSQFKLGNTR